MIIGIDPKVDYAFKHLFGRDATRVLLRHAEMMDPEKVPPTLRGPLFERALEELKMLTQDEIQREIYESRRKAQMDHISGLKDARREGEEQGLAKGEQIELIHAFEQTLSLAATPRDQLVRLTLEELTSQAEQLRSQAARK